MNQEVWKDIEGYEGFYQINCIGEIKRLSGYIVNSNGIKKKWKEKIIKNQNVLGYCSFNPCANGIQKTFRIHRLVAKAFIPNPGNKPQINHKNGIKTDNRIENLEWCNASENAKHSYKFGFNKPMIGEKNGMAKLNDKKVRVIFHLKNIIPKMCQKEIAKIFKISQSNVSEIWNRHKWWNLTKNI